MQPPHRSPVRRNRHIGTKKAGYKRQSRFGIPSPHGKPFYEQVEIERQCQREIHGVPFTFLVERLHPGYQYSCSVDDICGVLRYCPAADLAGLRLVVLRQPKKKERIFSPCWGRLEYAFAYPAGAQPAILIDAVDIHKDIKIKAADITPLFQREIERLRAEGHEVEATGRSVIIRQTLQGARRTQLYRTVLHEVGHYVFYRRAGGGNAGYAQREAFAEAYARRIGALIPGAGA